jgi:hypothetical protein
MNDQAKMEYYDILNSIRMTYLKNKTPFNIIGQDEIKLTYKEIHLKYIKGKNYFVQFDPNHKPKKRGGAPQPILVFS